MQVFINSRTIEIDDQTQIGELLERLGFKSELIAVECDGRVISRASWAKFKLFDGAQIEVVQFVGGG